MNQTVSHRRVGELREIEFLELLETGIGLRIGPFAGHIRARCNDLVEALYRLYSDYAIVGNDNVFSFHAALEQRRTFPFLHRKMVRFSVDGRAPHEDLPAYQALPVLEWGLNLVIALRSHSHLMLHAGALALGDSGMLLPAAPGQGKSTLCAGMALREWRLLSDEFGLVRPNSNSLIPIPRPVALKNESIDVVRAFDQAAEFGPLIPGTRKGDVAHLRPPGDCVLKSDETAPVRWIVFPRWQAGSECVLTEIPRAEGFMLLASNAFNYEVLGEAGFRTVSAIVGSARCFRFTYSCLDTAVAALTDFARRNDS